MDENGVRRWFGEYVEAFAACGRGESDARSLLAYWGVPLLLSTDDGFFALMTEDEVRAAAQQQVDRMRAADYDHSAVLGFKVTKLNATSALYHGEYSWLRAAGDEISRPTLTYLLTSGSAGPRISALVVQSR